MIFFRPTRPYEDVTSKIIGRPSAPLGDSFWGYIRRCVKEMSPDFWIMFTFGVLLAASNVFINYPIKMATNALVHHSNDAVFMACIVFGSLMVLRTLVEQLCWFFSYRVKFFQHGYLNSMLVQQVLQNPIRFFENNTQGKITSSIIELENHTRLLFSFYMWHFMPNVVFVLVSIGIIFSASMYLALLFTAWVIVYFWLHSVQAKHLYDTALASGKQSAQRDSLVGDIIANFRNIVIFGRREYEQRNLAEENSRLLHKSMRFRDAITGGDLIDQLMVLAMYLATFLICVNLAGDNKITIGDFSLIVALVINMTARLRAATERLRYSVESYGKVKHSLRFLFGETASLSITNEEHESEADTNQPVRIEFNDVTFIYPGTEQAVLNNISLPIRQNERIGLVGASGAGKSTLVNMLLRLYEPDSGTITIDGKDIRHFTPETLRDKIAYIPQDTGLFHRSIRTNIAYGKPDATDEEIVEAARAAQAHDFIMKLPEGYNTMVGERGVKLSGGQRQRIAIARALLKNAPILILDEATSALDSEAEAAIQAAIGKVMEGKTVIAIAHRLSTIATMDKLIVLENGHIVEEGTHAELVQRGDIYARLWQRQSGGFVDTMS